MPAELKYRNASGWWLKNSLLFSLLSEQSQDDNSFFYSNSLPMWCVSQRNFWLLAGWSLSSIPALLVRVFIQEPSRSVELGCVTGSSAGHKHRQDHLKIEIMKSPCPQGYCSQLNNELINISNKCGTAFDTDSGENAQKRRKVAGDREREEPQAFDWQQCILAPCQPRGSPHSPGACGRRGRHRGDWVCPHFWC